MQNSYTTTITNLQNKIMEIGLKLSLSKTTTEEKFLLAEELSFTTMLLTTTAENKPK